MKNNSYVKSFSIIILTAAFIVSGFFVPSAFATVSLGVTQISAVQTYATADNTFEHGWRWVFDVTVPDNETTLKMKFDNWFNGTNSILAQNNIRFYSSQSSNSNSVANAIIILDANTYSSVMNIDPAADLNSQSAGRQIQITVEARVPVGSAGGSYSTSYGIHTWANQNISFNNIGEKTYGDIPFALSASASSGLPVTFTLVSGPATLTGNTITITGVGTVVVRASQAGNDSFNPASDVDQIFNVIKANPTITWNDPANITYPTALGADQLNAIVLGAGGASLAGAFVYIPDTGAVLNAGPEQTLSVTFTPTDTVNYNPVTQIAKINVLKAGQAIDWSNPANIVYGTSLSAVQLNAIVSVTGSTPAGALTYSPVSGIILGAGLGQTLSVTAEETPNYNSATKTVTINVLKAEQTITFANPGNKNLGDAPFALSASASSGLPVSFTLVSGPATLIGNTLTLNAAGTVVVRASQSGDSNFNPASDVEQTFNVLDTVAPLAGDLTWATVNHPTNLTVSPISGKYTIPTPLMGSDVFASLSIVVTDLDLNTNPVPVFIDSNTTPNGNMVYSGGIWNYVPGTPVVFGDGVHHIVATFKDNSDNPTTLTLQFTTDAIKPVIESRADVTYYVATKVGANVAYILPAVTDNLDTGLVATCLPVSGSMFLYGETTVTCSTEDSAGNHAVDTTFKVIVNDNVFPTLVIYTINNLIISPNGDGNKDDATIDLLFSEKSKPDLNILNSIGTKVRDLYSSSSYVTDPYPKKWDGKNDLGVGVVVPDGIYTVQVIIKDEAGNVTIDTSKTITVDNTLPVIALHADVIEYVATSVGKNVTYTLPTVTDVGSPSLVAICSPVSGSFFSYGDTTVNCDVTDVAGNQAVQTHFVVHIVDNVMPTATISYDKTASTNTDVIATITPSEPVTITSIGGLTHTFTENGIFEFTFVDTAGNLGSVDATVSNIDRVPPVITLNGSGNNGDPTYVIVGNPYNELGATATDIVDGPVTVIPSGTVGSIVGDYIVTYTATDTAGNTATKTRTVKVIQPEYDIAIISNTGGTISVVAQSLTDVKYKITPDAGYRTIDVLIDGQSKGVITEYTFTNVTGPHTISATFELIPLVPMSISYSVPVFTVGQQAEFTVSTVGNSDTGKLVRAYFNVPSGAYVEYFEIQDSNWYPLPNEYGPQTGFPVGDVTSKFRSNFTVAGQYTVTVTFKTMGDTVFATKDIVATVISDNAGVATEDFGVMNFSGVKGYSVGFGLLNANASDVQNIVVKLYKGDTLLGTNTSTAGLFTNYPTATSLSAPFDVFGTFNYVADGNWIYSGWSGVKTDIPTKAEITVTFKNGVVKTVTNFNLTGDTTLFN